MPWMEGPTRRTAWMAMTMAGVALALAAAAARGQVPYLVRDLAPGYGSPSNYFNAYTAPHDLVQAGGRTFFFGSLSDDSGQSLALWVTDGTPTGTQPLAELCSCAARFAAAAGPLVYAVSSDATSRTVLWRSDGTRAGTFRLTVPPTSAAAGPAWVGSGNYAVAGGALYFLAGGEIWRSDGTAAGTAPLAGLAPNAASSLTAFAGKVYFLNPLASDGQQVLWRSDGTAAGTQPYKMLDGDQPSLLTAAGSQLFCIALANPQGNPQLWVTDGTSAPHAVTQFASATALTDTTWLKAEGNQVYFIADDGGQGDQLWVSDGTAAGTAAVSAFTIASVFQGPDQVAVAGGHVFFFATDGNFFAGLWSSAGSPPSTVGLCGQACSSQDGSNQLVVAGSRVVFLSGSLADGFGLWGTDGTPAGTTQLMHVCDFGCGRPVLQQIGSQVFVGSGTNLWVTDGTAAGTHLYDDDLFGRLYAAIRLGPPTKIVFVGGELLITGTELWATDGTVPGTRQLTNLLLPNSSSPGQFTAAGDLAIFTAFAGSGQEPSLFASGGTTATTVPVPGAPLPDGRYPLTAVAGKVFFVSGGQIWRTDGTAAGTLQVTSIAAGSRLLLLAPDQAELFFLVSSFDGSSVSVSTWTSDGTVAGTVQLGELPAVAVMGTNPNASISGLWGVGGERFFQTDDRTSGQSHLWRTDGTAAGTVELGNVPITFVPQVTQAGGRFFFVGGQNQFISQLWQTDGTAAGTVPVLAGATPVGGGEGSVSNLVALGGVLYFTLTHALSLSTGSVALWRSDGTSSGTYALATYPTGGNPWVSRRPAVVGDQLVFAVDDDIHGAQLWGSDGTAAGTRLLHDFDPGPPVSRFMSFTAAAGRAYFNADDGVHGWELWETDGTAAGTRMVQDVSPGPDGSGPAGMTAVGNLLFWSADDGLHGVEPWALPLSGAAACQPSATALCLLARRFKVEASWIDPQGNTGDAQAVALTPDTGTFWFFSPDNVEVVGKVIDGRTLNSSFWFFYGALSDVEYWLTVTDTATGAARRYYNPAGQMASVGDTTAFGPQGALAVVPPPAAPASPPAAPPLRTAARAAAAALPAARARGDERRAGAACRPAAAQLCLHGGRFAVTVAWQDFKGHQGHGTAVDLSGDTGYFWFFDAANVELVLKVLDGRPLNGKFWVFYGALSNVAYTITVRDTVTGHVRTYTNPLGEFASVGDTAAF
jgi:ELWxxDGT repeat protein